MMCCARFPALQASFAREVTRGLLATALGLGFLSTAAMSQVLNDGAWVTNGAVSSIATSGGVTYLGGAFTYMGPLTGNCVALDANTGALVPGMPRVNGAIAKVISDGAGGWIIAGSFESVDGEARVGLARIRADMTLDPWTPDIATGSAVLSIARSGSILYACGVIYDSQGGARFLMAYDLTTGNLTAWDPHPDAPVLAVAVSGTTVYAGGDFVSIGGQSRNALAAIDASTGLATPWNPVIAEGDGEVSRIESSESAVYVSGSFSRVDGQDRIGFAVLDAVTGLVTDWYPAHDSYLSGFAVDGQTVYLVGGFTTMGGESRAGIAALDAVTAAVLPWHPGASDGQVSGIHIQDSRIFVTGPFSHIGGLERSNIAELDASTAAVTGWEPPPFGGNINSMCLLGSRIVAVGYFNSVGGLVRNNIAAVDAVTGVPTPWNPGSDANIVHLAANGSQVFAAGNFTIIGGQARSRLAALDVVTGLATAWNPQPDGSVHVMMAAGSTVYVGGYFSTIGGQPRSHLAALDANSGLATEWNPSVSGSGGINCLASSGSTVYVGGGFTQVGGQERSNLAAIDATTGLILPWNPGSNGALGQLLKAGGIVYAAGPFTQIGGASRAGLAAVDAVTGLATTWNPGQVYGQVQAMAVTQTTLYVGGRYSRIGFKARRNLAAFDLGSGAVTSWDPKVENFVNALSIADGQLYVGGAFPRVAGQPRQGYAQYSLDLPVVQVIAPNGGEQLFLGRLFTFLWTAYADVGITVVDLELSRLGPSGPWERLYSGNNAGGYTWTVTDPTSNGQAYFRVVAHDAQGHELVDQSDAPFSISSDPDDVTAPVVQVLAPNGHETYFIGEERVLNWSVTDDVGVQRVDVYLSRSGPLGPWIPLYEDAAPTAYQNWIVTGPAVFDDVYLRVVARDHGGNIGVDMNDIAFSIAEQSVPTLIDLFHAVPTPSGVRLEWKVSDTDAFQSIALERASTASGVWSRVNAIPVNDGRLSWVLDLEAPAGETQWYRLNGVQRDGRTFRFGPISVEVQAPVIAFSLSPLTPNPTAGRSVVSFAVPQRAVVKLTLSDVQGRELAVLAHGPREPGRHSALLDTSDLPAGLYFLQLEAGGLQLRQRVTVMR